MNVLYKLKIHKELILIVLSVFLFGSCRLANRKGPKDSEHSAAIQLMQGIWQDIDDGSIVFKISGDTIYYPESEGQPSIFTVVGDTIVVSGFRQVKYPIIRQTDNRLDIEKPSGETVSLVRCEDDDASDVFYDSSEPFTLNQGQLIKRDTVVMYNANRYHLYVQVNPTTYRVLKDVANEDGLVVSQVYYDNIVNLTLYCGARRITSRDFHKKEFEDFIPQPLYEQSILSDIEFEMVDSTGFHYEAVLGQPDSPVASVASIVIGFDGRLSISK